MLHRLYECFGKFWPRHPPLPQELRTRLHLPESAHLIINIDSESAQAV